MGTWEESVEERLAFVEAVIRAGHSVGQQPGSGPTFAAPETPLGSAKDAHMNPPPPPPKQPKQKAEK